MTQYAAINRVRSGDKVTTKNMFVRGSDGIPVAVPFLSVPIQITAISGHLRQNVFEPGMNELAKQTDTAYYHLRQICEENQQCADCGAAGNEFCRNAIHFYVGIEKPSCRAHTRHTHTHKTHTHKTQRKVRACCCVQRCCRTIQQETGPLRS